MPPEPGSAPESDPRAHAAREWLRKVSTDLAAGAILAAHPELASAAAFHAQQAAEKALKAFLTWCDVPFRRIHDIDELLAECATLNAGFLVFHAEGSNLTAYAAETRYPGGDVTPEQATEAQRVAREVVAFVRGVLPPEALP